ncbi:MAG: SsrA-binding protein SmpB [Candidatus Latescibacterota bacterium]
MAEAPPRLVAQNRKARHDYHILSHVEAGLVLQGTEVKSLRLGQVNLRDSFARIENDEAWLHNMHINPYEEGNRFNHDPTRKRKLLLHRIEIKRLLGKLKEKGLTLVPLSLYFVKGRAKVELGLARGKHEYDKREDIARRDMQRDIARQLQKRD